MTNCLNCNATLKNDRFSSCYKCFIKTHENKLCEKCHKTFYVDKKYSSVNLCYSCYQHMYQSAICVKCGKNFRKLPEAKFRMCFKCHIDQDE